MLTIRGPLQGVTAKAYNSFTDAQGATRPGGVTYRLVIGQGFDNEPIRIKVKPEVAEEARQYGEHSIVEVTGGLRATADGQLVFSPERFDFEKTDNGAPKRRAPLTADR